MQNFYFSESQDAMELQTCPENLGSGLKNLQLDSLIWETASPRTQKPKIVNESLFIRSHAADQDHTIFHPENLSIS